MATLIKLSRWEVVTNEDGSPNLLRVAKVTHWRASLTIVLRNVSCHAKHWAPKTLSAPSRISNSRSFIRSCRFATFPARSSSWAANPAPRPRTSLSFGRSFVPPRRQATRDFGGTFPRKVCARSLRTISAPLCFVSNCGSPVGLEPLPRRVKWVRVGSVENARGCGCFWFQGHPSPQSALTVTPNPHPMRVGGTATSSALRRTTPGWHLGATHLLNVSMTGAGRLSALRLEILPLATRRFTSFAAPSGSPRIGRKVPWAGRAKGLGKE